MEERDLGLATFKIPVADPVTSRSPHRDEKAQAARSRAATARRRAGPDPNAPAESLALRLRSWTRKSPSEHLIARISAPSQLNALKTPRPAFFEAVPQPSAASNILLLIGNAYYDALTQTTASWRVCRDCGRR